MIAEALAGVAVILAVGLVGWAMWLAAKLLGELGDSAREQTRAMADLCQRIAATLHAEVVPPPLEQHSEVAAPVQRPDWAEPVVEPWDPTDGIEGLRDEDIGQRQRAVTLKSWERAQP